MAHCSQLKVDCWLVPRIRIRSVGRYGGFSLLGLSLCQKWIANFFSAFHELQVKWLWDFLLCYFCSVLEKYKDNKNILIIYSTAYLHYKNIIENPRRRDKKRVAIVESKIKRKPDQDNNGEPKHGTIRKDIMSSVDAK